MTMTDDGWRTGDWPTDNLVEPGWHEHGVEVVTADAFVDVDEPGALAILGTFDDVLIPQGGEAMMYGDGGTGKTTLAIDLACHLAAGDDWLGIPVDEPVSVLLIEGEGPRPLFRRKLRRKLAGWQGSAIEGRLHVWQHPWNAFTFADVEMRGQLARMVFEHSIDLVVAGPVTAIGMSEAGTMAEVRAFAQLVQHVREGSQRSTLATLLVHHESKSGRVSGAWEGVGDALIHVQGQGEKRTRVHMQKLRWSTRWHGTTLHLKWGEGESFTVDEQPKTSPDEMRDEMLGYVLRHGGCGSTELFQNVRGRKEAKYAVLRAQLDMRRIYDAGSGNRRAFWHAEDPARPAVTEPFADVVQLFPRGANDGTTDGPHGGAGDGQ